MLSELRYADLAIYPSNAPGPVAERARAIAWAVKNGDQNALDRVVKRLREHNDLFADLLDPERVLVPVPRSSITASDAFWPADRICRFLHRGGFGAGVERLVRRTEKVAETKRAKGLDRPLPGRHVETMSCEERLSPPDKITLVDDIVTKGSTALGAASVISRAYPNIDIALFAVFRTVGFRTGEVTAIIEPCRSRIIYDPRTGRADRRDD